MPSVLARPPAVAGRAGRLAMQALSGDGEFLRSLPRRRGGGSVHSVFERVVNVEDLRGELFTIAARDLDNAPNTLVADAARFTGAGIERGQRVEWLAGGFVIDRRILVDLEGAKAWDAFLPRYPADDSMLRQRVAGVRARMGSGLFAARPRSAGPAAASMMAALQQHASMLGAALRAGDMRAAGLHGSRLVGLGPGLTPSGDDFLVGLFTVLHLPQGPHARLRNVCDVILAGVDQRTNAISAAALKAAARGRVREVIHLLVRELVGGSPQAMAAALARVLAVGSTSGADIAAGILCGLETCGPAQALQQ